MANRPLILRFGADTSAATRDIGALAQSVAASMGTVASVMAVTSANSNVAGAAALGAAANVGKLALAWQLAQGAAALAGAAFLAATMELAKAQKIADRSTEAGVGTTFWQAWTLQAKEARIEAKTLQDALSNAERAGRTTFTREAPINERLRLFQGQTGIDFGDGVAAAASRALQAENQEDRVRAILDTMRELEAAGERLAAIDLASEFFGPAFADRIRTGRVQIEEFARDLTKTLEGAGRNASIISPETIQRAEALNERLREAWRLVSEGLNPVFRDLAALGTLIYSGFVPLVELFGSLVTAAGNLYDAVSRIVKAIPSLGAIGRVQMPAISGRDELAEIDAEIERVRGEIRSLPPPRLGGADGLSMARQARQSDLDRLLAERGQISERAERERTVPQPPEAPPPPQPVSSDDIARWRRERENERSRPRASGGRSDEEIRQDQIERQIEGLERVNRVLTEEAGLINASRDAREKAVAVARIGNDLTAEQKARVEGLVEANIRHRDTIERVEAAQRGVNDLLRAGGEALGSFIADIGSGGQNAERALMNITKRLIEMGTQAFLLGSGPLAQILGTAPAVGSPAGSVGGIFGFLGGLFSGRVMHEGGVVGGSGPARSVPASLFNGARRFHGGGPLLGPGEVPIIGQLGEEMLTKRQRQNAAAAMAGGGGAAGLVKLLVELSPSLVVSLLERAAADVDVKIAETNAHVGPRALEAFQRARINGAV
jgi:hypothetical protein